MASIDDAIFARLAASTAVTGLVTTGGIYNLQAAQGITSPFIVFNVFSPQSVDSADGVDSMTGARLQIDSYGSDKDQAMRVALAVRNNLADFRGFSNSIYVTRCLGPRTGFGLFEESTRLYREMREYSIGYYETTA